MFSRLTVQSLKSGSKQKLDKMPALNALFNEMLKSIEKEGKGAKTKEQSEKRSCKAKPTREDILKDKRIFPDFKNGPLTEYRESASFCYKKMNVLLEGEDFIRLKVSNDQFF